MKANEKMLNLYLDSKIEEFSDVLDSFIDKVGMEKANQEDIDSVDAVWMEIKEVFVELLKVRQENE